MTSIAPADEAFDRTGRRHARSWYLFLMLVSLATLLPFAVTPLVSDNIPSGTPLSDIYLVAGFLGANFHVAATGWFYVDPEMRSHFRARPLRYLLVPILLVPSMAAAFYLLNPAVSIYLLLAFVCWQLWHYQKQNFGLLSFIAAGTDGVSLSLWERRTLTLAGLAGIAGFFSLGDTGPASLSKEFAFLHQAGLVLYCLVPIAFCVTVIKSPALRANTLRLLFFAFGSLFFLPTFVFSDSASALVGYATAHGLQYCVFMGYVSLGRGKAVVSLIKLLIIAACGGLILDRVRDAPHWHWTEHAYGYAVYGAFLGVVMVHFVLDAGIWRLREKFQRAYMRERFHFVFDR